MLCNIYESTFFDRRAFTAALEREQNTLQAIDLLVFVFQYSAFLVLLSVSCV